MAIRRKKKGQAALEYLTTYGWLLIIIIIVAAALAGLGMFKKSTYQPAACTGFAKGLVYVEHKIDTNGDLTLVLTNSMGKQVSSVQSVTMTLPDNTNYTDNSPVVDTPWDSGDRKTIFADSGAPPLKFGGVGTTYSVSVAIRFTTEGIEHLQAGICTGKVE